jgi:hypothetical protein
MAATMMPRDAQHRSHGATAGGHPLVAADIGREELLAAMPPGVREVFPSFDWDVRRLWSLPLPARTVPVETFEWLQELPVWRWGGERFQISLRDVLDDPQQFSAHHAKAMATDLSFPIHVTTTPAQRLVILDGYHRLLKALFLGQRTISVVQVSAEDLR